MTGKLATLRSVPSHPLPKGVEGQRAEIIDRLLDTKGRLTVALLSDSRKFKVGPSNLSKVSLSRHALEQMRDRDSMEAHLERATNARLLGSSESKKYKVRRTTRTWHASFNFNWSK